MLKEADTEIRAQKEVEVAPEPIIVHTFEDYVTNLAEQMEIPREALYGVKGDPKNKGFLDEKLVTSPHQLTGLVKMREDAPDVVLQTVEPLVMTGFGKRVPTGFEISAKANDGLDIKKYRELLQEKINGEIWLDFNSDRATAAAFLAEAARLEVVNTSHLVPDSLKHTGQIAQWERENLEDKAREALGAKKPFRDKDRLKRLAWGSLVLAYGCAPFVSDLPPIDNGDSAGDGGQPDSGDSGPHISPPDNQGGQPDSGDINSPDTPSFESFTPAPDFFVGSTIDKAFSVQTIGDVSDSDIVSKISAAESRRNITGFATQALTLTDADGDNELRIYASQGNQSYFYSDVVYDESTDELKYVPPGRGEDGSEHGVFIPMRAYKAENGENVIALAHEFVNPDTQEAGWIAVVDVWRYVTDENGNLTSMVYTDPYSKMSVNIGIPEGGLNAQPTPTSPSPTEIPEGLLVSLNNQLVQATKVVEATPTPTQPEPTEVLPTATPEYAADNFVELIDQKVAEFGGMQALEQELDKHDMLSWIEVKDNSGNTLGYGPPINYGEPRETEKFWTVNSEWLSLGLERLSLEDVPGAHEGDFVQIMLGARPQFADANQTEESDGPPIVMPFIVGVRWQGQWAHANDIWETDPTGEHVIAVQGVDSPEGLESYLNKFQGKLLSIKAYRYFENEGDWSGIHFDNHGKYKGSDASPVIKAFMDALKNGYIQRASRDHGLLEDWPTLEQIYNALDPESDYGLFVEEIFDTENIDNN